MNWRAIKTAPRDGTRILIAYCDQYGPTVATAERVHGEWLVTGRTKTLDHASLPTQWMPLPAYPSKPPSPARIKREAAAERVAAAAAQHAKGLPSEAEKARGWKRPNFPFMTHLRCNSRVRTGHDRGRFYAKDPGRYKEHFCRTCDGSFQTGAGGEFVWHGTDIKVGT